MVSVIVLSGDQSLTKKVPLETVDLGATIPELAAGAIVFGP